MKLVIKQPAQSRSKSIYIDYHGLKTLLKQVFMQDIDKVKDGQLADFIIKNVSLQLLTTILIYFYVECGMRSKD